MDSGAVSRAAKVPDVSSRLDFRTSESVTTNLPAERDAGEREAHDGEVVEESKDAGATNGETNAINEAEHPLQTSETTKRKRSVSESHDVTKGCTSIAKRKKRVSEPENFAAVDLEEERNRTAVLQTIPEKMRKYFAQRHRLFHRYDEGIQLDEEAWFSVTPEKIAAHIASRFSHLKVVVDLYSCVGGNSIQFAKAGMRVIAVEIDQDKINMAKHNAAIYGVEDRIEFKKGDVLEELSSLRDQVDKDWGIFLSPPWGGPSYLKHEVFDVSIFKEAVEKATQASSNVAILVPRNISIENVTENFDHCEVEDNYLGGKLKTKTLYFGALEGHRVTLDEIQGF